RASSSSGPAHSAGATSRNTARFGCLPPGDAASEDPSFERASPAPAFPTPAPPALLATVPPLLSAGRALDSLGAFHRATAVPSANQRSRRPGALEIMSPLTSRSADFVPTEDRSTECSRNFGLRGTSSFPRPSAPSSASAATGAALPAPPRFPPFVIGSSPWRMKRHASPRPSSLSVLFLPRCLCLLGVGGRARGLRGRRGPLRRRVGRLRSGLRRYARRGSTWGRLRGHLLRETAERRLPRPRHGSGRELGRERPPNGSRDRRMLGDDVGTARGVRRTRPGRVRS